jgi:uncharacterized membrane protein YfcA
VCLSFGESQFKRRPAAHRRGVFRSQPERRHECLVERKAAGQKRERRVTATLPLELALGFAIGVSLGLLGGGGSILTVPALVYLVGQSPQAAITTSLAIVGANSALGASFHRSQGTVRWRVALVFGGVGMLVAFFAANIGKLFPPALLLVLFAVLMLAIGGLMLRSAAPVRKDTPGPRLPVVIAGGAGVGLLTGILGVGGGFLIVPALVMLVGLPMKQAVGTSLVVIAMNSAAGLLGHLGVSELDLVLTFIFVAAGLVGVLTGTRLVGRLPAVFLRRGFGVFVILLALFLLYDNLPRIQL